MNRTGCLSDACPVQGGFTSAFDERDEPPTEVTTVKSPANPLNQPNPPAPRQTHTCPRNPELSYPTVGE